MKRICSYVKNTLAISLVIMLMLGMMLGVLTLSASADADNLPVLVNHPTLIYHKTPKVHPDDNDTTWIDDEYYHYSSFNVVMDDSECNDVHKLDAITSIDYHMEYYSPWSSSDSSSGKYFDLENYDVPDEYKYNGRGYVYLEDFNGERIF